MMKAIIVHDSMANILEALTKENRELKEALKEASKVRDGLIRWRQNAFPHTDQRTVIEREFPRLNQAIKTVANHKTSTKGDVEIVRKRNEIRGKHTVRREEDCCND